MTIPLGFLTRYAIPLIVASIYLGNESVNIPEQIKTFERTSLLADQVLSEAKGEGEGLNEEFDYIIVGGGTAGSILANRLSASGSERVLVLEAGGDPSPVFDIPSALGFFFQGPLESKWDYRTVRQERACRNQEGLCSFPRGRMLGGCSSINGMVYNRAKPKDYDLWAEFTGDASWSWDRIHPVFNSFEDYHGHYEGSSGHGTGGELHITGNYYLPGLDVLEEALLEKGYPFGDSNAGRGFSQGFSKFDFNRKEGIRMGTYQAFLEPVLNRTNLLVYRYALATKIEFEGARAKGVTYTRHGKSFFAEAKKDVILSAGPLESPKLLMLSGVGPRNHLEELGIELKLELPVGLNVQEHTGVQPNRFQVFRVNTTFGQDPHTTEALLEYLEGGGKGPLEDGNGYGTLLNFGYLNSAQNGDEEWPDLRVYFIQVYDPQEQKQEFGFGVEILRTNGTGSVKLAGKDPEEMPLYDPNLFEDEGDIERVIDGIEIARDILLNSSAFQAIGIQDMPVYPACAEHEFASRAYWACYVQHESRANHHAVAGCRMGPNEALAVIDSELRVFGTENLRVVDASSIPFVPSGNTNLPVMLVAQKASEIILGKNK